VGNVYYALWIPVLEETELKLIKENVQKQDISDNGNDPFEVEVSINPSSFNININCKKDGQQKHVDLILEHRNSCGMLVYRLETEDETSFLSKKLHECIPKAIYHIIKEFFHEHKFHSSEEDSHLKPYFLDSPIKANDLTPIKHYLNEYCEMFKAYKRELNEQWKEIVGLINKELPLKSFDACRSLIENCEKAKGEYLYCGALIGFLRKQQVLDDGLIHQIQSSIIDINVLCDKAKLSLDHTGIKVSAKLGIISVESGRRSVRLGALGVFLGVLSLIITLWPSDTKSYKELIKVDEKLNVMDSIQNQRINSILLIQESLMKEVDSLTNVLLPPRSYVKD
jgi:hypothetical protein